MKTFFLTLLLDSLLSEAEVFQSSAPLQIQPILTAFIASAEALMTAIKTGHTPK